MSRHTSSAHEQDVSKGPGATEGALAGAGSTIAVIGTGIDIVYPSAHAALAAHAPQGLVETVQARWQAKTRSSGRLVALQGNQAHLRGQLPQLAECLPHV